MGKIRIKLSNALYKFDGREFTLPDLKGEFSKIAVIKGETGSGKTVILKSLCGLIAPSEGKASLTKDDVDLESCFIHSQSEFNFVTGMISDELEFAGVDKSSFKPFLNKNVHELSGGELKRIAVMMALQMPYDVIVLDEPLDMLDDEQSKIVLEHIIEASKYKPIIIATHSKLFDEVADLILNLSEVTEEIFTAKPSTYFGKAVLSVKDLLVNVDNQIFPAINLEVKEGETVCLYGLNGSGKTLFIRTVAGIGRFPYNGSYNWEIDRLERGICLQFPEHMIYKENIKSEIEDLLQRDSSKVIALLGWEGREDESPFSLSDGEKRLLFIVSFLSEKKCCIFDEPFAGLDKKTANFIAKKIEDARDRGCGILYTANRFEETLYADKVIKMGDNYEHL